MQHNPVSIAIESLQEQWHEQIDGKGNIKIARWLINADEQSLLNGFLKLESSPYGSCDEFFLSLFSEYISERGRYAQKLILDLFQIWDEDDTVRKTGYDWDRTDFHCQMEHVEWPDDKCKTEAILIAVLNDFKMHFCKDGQQLVLVLLPSTIADVEDFNDWLIYISELLPEGIMLCLVDYINNQSFKSSIASGKETMVTLKCGRFDVRDMAANMIASQADPESPQTVFQQCVLKMGKATADKNRVSLSNWGDKAVKAAQQSGAQTFLATAYLVYAGFMMQFREKKSIELLHKGDAVAQMAYDSGEPEAPAILLQIYGYYSAYYSIMGDRKRACEWSLKQAEFAQNIGMTAYAMAIYRHTAQLSVKSDREIYFMALEKGYYLSFFLSDDQLKMTDIALIASHYMEELLNIDYIDKAKAIDLRMIELLDEDWNLDMPSLKDKHIEIDITHEIKQ